MVVDFSRGDHRVTGRRWPVVTYEELLRTGLSRAAIRHRAERGPLFRAHRGVYFIGTPDPPWLARALAAVLVCGGGSAVSHLPSAGHFALLDAPSRRVDVTVPGGSRPRHQGVHAHRVKELHPDDVWVSHGVPFVAPSRTLVDIATLVSLDRLEEALDNARRLRMATPGTIAAALDRAAGRPGAGRLRRLMEERAHDGFHRSPPERLLRRTLVAAGFPPAAYNHPALSYELDAAWPDILVGIEVDSASWHSSAREMDGDRYRDQRLEDAGWRIVRTTARELNRAPERLIVRVAEKRAEAMAERRALARLP